MFSFFKKKVTQDYSFLSADMHSHLLPGIDDGLENLEQTIQFAQELYILGYRKLICTPHILPGVHDNTPEIILSKLAIVQQAVQDAGIDIKFEAAAEYMVGVEFHEQIKSGNKLLTFGDNYILIEMSYAALSPNIPQVIFDLKINGYQPILAHPERYGYYHGNIEVFEEFVNRGCLLQVNLLSLTGFYGKPVQKTAEKLLKQGMVSFLGTDMHHAGHLSMTKALVADPAFHKLVSSIQFKNMSLL